jgi:peptidoglycan/xylan/chitin deacetylase (PgdA/CDA1 family)
LRFPQIKLCGSWNWQNELWRCSLFEHESDMNTMTRVPVLMYHRVGMANNPWEARYAISPANFAAHMETLARKGYRAVAADALVDWLEGGPPLPAGAFVLTFDDGFRGVREHALPVLERMGWPFTVFLVSGLIGGEDVWTRAFNPDGTTYPLLDEAEIRDMLERGVSFHSHTRSHADLPTLGDVQLADQLASPRDALAKLVGHDVPYIAYPFGHVDERVEAATRAAGYRAAFSTQPGFNRRDVNPFRIRRLDVFGTDTPAMLLRKIKLGTNDGSLAHAARYYLSRLGSHLPGAGR